VSALNPDDRKTQWVDELISSVRMITAEPDANAPPPPIIAKPERQLGDDPIVADDLITSTIPGQPWSVEIPASNFKLGYVDRRGPRERYFAGRIDAGELDFSVIMYPYAEGKTASQCREYHIAGMKRGGALSGDEGEQNQYEVDGIAILDYRTLRAVGKPANRYHLHAWYAREGFCIVLHFSKENATESDRKRMTAIARSTRLRSASP
jgi:hypothetical protein